MLIIGEKINASNRAVGEAIARRGSEFLVEIARAQAEAGADYIDVNAGSGKGVGNSETEAIEWLVEVIQEATDKPLTIDSESPDIIEAALRKYRGQKVMINSVTAEESRLEPMAALAVKYKASLVALAMGKGGIPDTVEKRLAACEQIMTCLTEIGVAAEQVFFDPLVLPVSVDSRQGLVTLKTLEQIKSRYPNTRTIMGLSNISFGLPSRKLINRSFFLMAAYAGLDAVILDPLDMGTMSCVKAADLLVGKDSMCRNYLRAHRKGIIMD